LGQLIGGYGLPTYDEAEACLRIRRKVQLPQIPQKGLFAYLPQKSHRRQIERLVKGPSGKNLPFVPVG
jgi:hypothetical protein